MKAIPIFQQKRLIAHSGTGEIAIAELKIWKVPRSKDYPQGVKFSLFLVRPGEVILGVDNHKPKGPHLHLGTAELPYLYQNDEKLQADFWNLVRKAGYLI